MNILRLLWGALYVWPMVGWNKIRLSPGGIVPRYRPLLVFACIALLCITTADVRAEDSVKQNGTVSSKPVAASLPFVNIDSAGGEGEKIAEVRISGNRRIESSAILNVVQLKAGDIIANDRTDADIRAIYKLGHFQNIEASTESSPKGIVLVYTVLEKPIVRDINFEGNKELKNEKLTADLEIHKNMVFTTKDLDRSVAKIKKHYGDEGYYLADVVANVTKSSPTDLSVTFKITEGNKILISAIHFDGNKAFSDSKLGGVIETKTRWIMSWLTGAGTYKEEAIKKDTALLTDYYMNNGYINVKVGEPVVKMNDTKDALEVSIGITEGEQYRIGTIDFKGELLIPAEELLKKVKSKTGDVFNRSILGADLAALTDIYVDKGYAFTNVNPETRLDIENKKIDLLFDMQKGNLISFERINIAGNTKTRDKVIRRELRVSEGELYSSTGLRRSKQNLMNTGYFEDASFATVKGSDSNKLNVNVEVKEKPTGSFSLGGGYSSLDGIIGQASIQQANFLGRGLKANLSGSIGGKSQTYTIGLTDPYFLDTKWNLGADLYRIQRDYTDYSRRLTGGDIKGGYPINDFIGTFFMYKYEVKDIYNPQSAYAQYNKMDPENYPLGVTTTSSVSGSITHNNTDYRMDPTTGFINSVSAEFAGLGGDNKFARYTIENTWFQPIYQKLIFSTRFAVGYIQDVGGAPIPIDEKFYLGGISTLRGYKARTVAPYSQKIYSNPVNSDQTPQFVYLGGNKEFHGSIELTFPLLADIGIKGVVFFDYGNATSANFNKMFDVIQTSYGGGIRWSSPLGPLRLEYGVPINPRKGLDGRNGRFEFSIGTLF